MRIFTLGAGLATVLSLSLPCALAAQVEDAQGVGSIRIDGPPPPVARR